MTSSQNKVALVTGAGRRIGACICRTLHKTGWNVVIHCHKSYAQANELADELNSLRANSARVIQADLNLLADIRSLAVNAASTWGRLDALINNASSFFPTPVESASEDQWNNLINSNLKAPFFLSQAVIEALRQTRGCIINITDIFSVRPMPGHSIYSIAKAGNAMLTKSLALELSPDVRVNGVAPGAILWPEDAHGKEIASEIKLQQIPLGALGGAQTIADTVRFLIEDAPYITGEIITVDGGRSLMQ